MRLACDLGARDFDPGENLVRLTRSDVPAYGGCAVGHTSLEYAIALLETRGDLGRARRILHRILDLQVREERNPGHGNFPFMSHWKEVSDPNAVCFLTPNLVYVWTRHRDRLDTRLRRRLSAAWPLCAHALMRYHVVKEYSNIFLLSLLSKFLLAPLLPRSDLAAVARTQWRDWMYFTARYGLTEYNSPTYVPVCIYALERLRAFGPRDLRQQFERVLEYLYFEFAARWHAPSGYLTGAMSRAYPNDMIPGRSYSAVVAHLQWGTDCDPDSPIIVNWLLSGYVAPASIARIALHKKLPVEIRSDVANLGIHRTDYLATEFALGSQTGNFCHPQEVPIFIAVRGEGPRRCVYIKPSFPRAARFISQQRANRVLGFYSFDPITTRYYYRGWNVRPEPNLPKSLTFDWQLGTRDLVREVWVEGERWDGRPRSLNRDTWLVAVLGSACLGLRCAVLGERRRVHNDRVRLAWVEDRLVMSVIVCEDARAHVDRPGLAAMAFYLQVAKATHKSTTRVFENVKHARIHARRPQSGKSSLLVSISDGAVPLTISAPVVPSIHASKQAQIEPDRLLGYFHGSGHPPW
jgi:hypothetical protein